MPLIDRLQLLGQMNALPEQRHGTYRGRIPFENHMAAQITGSDALHDRRLSQALQTIHQLTAQPAESTSTLGGLSARFESGNGGVAAIGYDPVGGTSYGTYQIASRPGTMDRFLQFLDKAEPTWAARLRAAGPANTGSTSGGMPTVWKAIAAEHPQRFERLQRQFIEETHYEPARQAIFERTGFDVAKAPKAVAEALWSTAVQHGPAGAARLFSTALNEMRTSKVWQNREGHPEGIQELLRRVYAARGADFESSPASVRNAVLSRLSQEHQLALALLGGSTAA